MRSVAFMHPGNASMASYRYRCAIPAEQVCASVAVANTEIVVISKPWDVALAKRLKAEGRTLVVDFCDDHFSHHELGSVYREHAQLADVIVCPTARMRDRLLNESEWEYGGIFNSHAHKYAGFHVIPDPYEFDEVAPHADGDKVIWFGHNAGLKALYYQPPNLTIVTGPKVNAGMVLYSPETLKEEMLKANIAIFPTVKGHEYKSPNRLINALRMGLFPVCDPHPSYTEFKKFIWSTEVPTGIKWCREFHYELNGFVKLGQDYIRDKYSPEAIGKQWRDLLESL